MKIIDAKGLHFRTLNDKIRDCGESQIKIENCIGQRYICAGSGQGRAITIDGTPGNALGAYLDGAAIAVNGNGQDATGDTMNDGSIVIYGNSGDATGYAMRGGSIFIKGDAGYRTGIHMKAYREKQPLIVIGGRTGSFLGEYQAGGTIIVLGIGCGGNPPVGCFTGTGMHGGRIFLRCNSLPNDLPEQVQSRPATQEDLASIQGALDRFADLFDADKQELMDSSYFVLTPNTANPYKRLYTYN